jgi:hypothetical protein
MYERNVESRSCNHSCNGKAIIILSVFVSSMQFAYATSLSVACLAIQNFST